MIRSEDSPNRRSRRVALSIAAILSGFIAGVKSLVGQVTASDDQVSVETNETTTTTTTTGTTTTTTETTTTTITESTTTTVGGLQPEGRPTIGLAVPPDTLNPLKAESVYSFYIIDRVTGSESVSKVTTALLRLSPEEELIFERTFVTETEEPQKKSVTIEDLPPGEYRAETEWKGFVYEKSFVVPAQEEEEEDEEE